MNRSQTAIFLVAVTACAIEDDPPLPPVGGTGGSVTVSAGGGEDGTADDGDGGEAGEGADADDTAGDDAGNCEEEDMVQLDCLGLAAVRYCRADNTSVCSMFPLNGSGEAPAVLGCVAPRATTSGSHEGIEFGAVCGVWAGDAHDYGNSDDPIVSEVWEKCEAECESILTSGFGPLQIEGPLGEIWNAMGTHCFFGSDLDEWSQGANGPDLSAAMLECGFQAGSDGYPPAMVEESPNGEPIWCSLDSCTTLVCDDYDYAVLQATSTTNSTSREIYATVPLAAAETLQESPSEMFCSNGRYVWSSTTTRSRFEGLGTGDLYYELGFRNDDRILSMWRFNPANRQLVGTVYTVDDPADILDAYDALMTSGTATYVAVGIRRGGRDWTVFVSAP